VPAGQPSQLDDAARPGTAEKRPPAQPVQLDEAAPPVVPR
jgi:hypothetical protein